MKTYSPKPDHIERRWYVLDAGEHVLGRVASEAAVILRGKHKPIYAPHMDVGDNLIIINADKVVLTGGKETKKIAWRHSGHPGGITGTPYEELLAKRPAYAVEKAVRGMLPKNRLGRSMIKKLHVVVGPDHRHQAQKPEEWTIGSRPAWGGLPTRSPSAPAEQPRRRGPAETGPEEGVTAAETTAKKKTTAKRPSTARKTASETGTTDSRKTTTKKTAARKPAASSKPAAKKPTATKKPAAKAATSSRKTTAAKKKET
jgi:large subunit ribosomal protein L13